MTSGVVGGDFNVVRYIARSICWICSSAMRCFLERRGEGSPSG